jgi:hypothetical protein
VRTMYIINFLAAAALPLAIASYGGHLAAKVLSKIDRKRALCVVWTLAVLGVLLSGVQQVFVYRSRTADGRRQAALAAKDAEGRQQLQVELRATAEREDYLRTELDAIARFLRAPHPGMDMRGVTDVASRMAEHAMHH